MYLLRTIFAFLIALSLAAAPIDTAMAANSMTAKAAPAVTSSTAADMDAGMDDCAKMAKTSSQSECPCCDTKAKCSPDLCFSKCSNFLGNIVQPDYVWPQITLMKHVEGFLMPPDHLWAPQPPPPRA